MKRQLIICTLLLYGLTTAQAQENKKEKEDEGLKGSHQLALTLSHSHISEGINEAGNREWLIMPSWALDYNYWLTNKWAIGLQTDIITEDFKVKESSDNETLERSFPVAIVPAATYKASKHSSFILGMGGEFAKEGSFALTRLGYEIGWEIPGKWEIGGNISYDLKWNAYDTWTIGIVISKFFNHKK